MQLASCCQSVVAPTEAGIAGSTVNLLYHEHDQWAEVQLRLIVRGVQQCCKPVFLRPSPAGLERHGPHAPPVSHPLNPADPHQEVTCMQGHVQVECLQGQAQSPPMSGSSPAAILLVLCLTVRGYGSPYRTPRSSASSLITHAVCKSSHLDRACIGHEQEPVYQPADRHAAPIMAAWRSLSSAPHTGVGWQLTQRQPAPRYQLWRPQGACV